MVEKLLCLVCVVSAVVLASLAVSQLAGEVANRELQTELADWHAKGFVSESGSSRPRVEKILDTVVERNPTNPVLLLQASRVNEWFAFESRAVPVRTREFRSRALNQVTDLLAVRPASAVAWSSYFGNAIVHNGFTPSAGHALQRAYELGGWELETQRTLATMGINYWDLLNEQGRELIREVVRRGVLSDSTHHPRRLDRDLIDLAWQRGWHEHIKPLLVNDDQKNYFVDVTGQ